MDHATFKLSTAAIGTVGPASPFSVTPLRSPCHLKVGIRLEITGLVGGTAEAVVSNGSDTYSVSDSGNGVVFGFVVLDISAGSFSVALNVVGASVTNVEATLYLETNSDYQFAHTNFGGGPSLVLFDK